MADYPDLRYILAGKSDETERRRLTNIIRDLGLESHVHLPGFLPDAELIDHYLLADVFVMPSKKEGFGLVFIEALACGVPVVAGDADGSAEALQNGRLGLLIDPDDPAAIAGAIRQTLQHPGDPAARQKSVAAAFNYPDYKSRLWAALTAG
jgi:glycosyltransferase involved in cell wall biosynthesis